MKMFHHQIMHLLWCHEKKSLRSMNAHSSAHFLWDCSRWPYLYCMDLHKLYQMCDVKSLLGLKTITEAEKKNGPKMWESMQLVGISDDHKKGLRPLALSRENNYRVGYNKWRMKNANKNNTHVHNKPLIWLWIESKILVELFFLFIHVHIIVGAVTASRVCYFRCSKTKTANLLSIRTHKWI